jgi:hypothetical protein
MVKLLSFLLESGPLLCKNRGLEAYSGMLGWQSPFLELPLIHNLRVLDVGYFLPEIGNSVLCV